MPALSYSTSLIAGTNENVNDVQSLFNQVRDVVNALDNDNIKVGAAIDYAKIAKPAGGIPLTDLPAMTAGQLIVGDGTKGAVKSLSGAVSLSAAGAAGLQVIGAGPAGGVNIGVSDAYVPANCSFTPAAGSWLFWGKATINKGDASGVFHTELRLRTSTSVELGASYAGATDATGNVGLYTHVVFGAAALNGSTQVLLDARGAAYSGNNLVVNLARLIGLRYA